VHVDAATGGEAREKAHAEAITLYGSEVKVASIEHRMVTADRHENDANVAWRRYPRRG
jgi:hypothetical protein